MTEYYYTRGNHDRNDTFDIYQGDTRLVSLHVVQGERRAEEIAYLIMGVLAGRKPEAATVASTGAEADNAERVARCESVLAHYVDECDPTANLIDLLTDARHWCDRHDENFADLDRVAHAHYLEERDDDISLS